MSGQRGKEAMKEGGRMFRMGGRAGKNGIKEERREGGKVEGKGVGEERGREGGRKEETERPRWML